MRNTFLALSAAALTLAAAAPALAETAKSTFTYEGVTYTYKTTQVGKSTIYEGYATPGQKFRLVRNRDRVTGTANGIQVSFSMDQLTYPVSQTKTLASR